MYDDNSLRVLLYYNVTAVFVQLLNDYIVENSGDHSQSDTIYTYTKCLLEDCHCLKSKRQLEQERSPFAVKTFRAGSLSPRSLSPVSIPLSPPASPPSSPPPASPAWSLTSDDDVMSPPMSPNGSESKSIFNPIESSSVCSSASSVSVSDSKGKNVSEVDCILIILSQLSHKEQIHPSLLEHDTVVTILQYLTKVAKPHVRAGRILTRICR